jgi:hypothetical protein
VKEEKKKEVGMNMTNEGMDIRHVSFLNRKIEVGQDKKTNLARFYGFRQTVE